jgi:hypothetical protein
MHAAFPFVLFGSIALFVILGLLSMLSRGNLYDQIGQSGLTMGDGGARGSGAGGSAGGPTAVGSGAEPYDAPGFNGGWPSAQSEREEEIRQMLRARSERRVRRGEAPLDIDAEFQRLAGSATGGGLGAAEGRHDSGLTLEVRQLVQARNERRRRQGQPALDVDAEVARTLAELGG